MSTLKQIGWSPEDYLLADISKQFDRLIQIASVITLNPWSLTNGGTLLGPNIITGSTTNTLKFVFDNLGVTQTNGAGIWLQNPHSAANGAQQISPSTVWEGQGWKTLSGGASQSVKFGAWVTPVQGGSVTSGSWDLYSSINGSAYTSRMSLSSGGVLSIPGSVTIGSNLSINSQNITNTTTSIIVSGNGLQINNGTESGTINLGNSNTSTLDLSSVNMNISSSGTYQVITDNAAVWSMDDGAVGSFKFEWNSFASVSLTNFYLPGFSGSDYDRIEFSSGGGLQLATNFPSGTGGGVSIDFNSGVLSINDTRTSKKGMEYSATGYVTQTHSLTDKEYVDTHLNGKILTIGQTSLTSGTKAVSISGASASSRCFVTLVSDGGTVTTTVNYSCVCTTNTATITALTNSGSTNGSDTSTLNYLVVN